MVELDFQRQEEAQQMLLNRLASSSRRTLMREIVALADNKPLSLDMIKLVLSRSVFDESPELADAIPWPEGVIAPATVAEDTEDDLTPVIARGTSITLPEGLSDVPNFDGNNGFITLVQKLLPHIPSHEQADLVAWACSLADFQSYDDNSQYSRLLISMMEEFSSNSSAVAALFEYMISRSEDFGYTPGEGYVDIVSALDGLVMEICSKQKNIDALIFNLAQFPPEQYKKILGMMVNASSFATIINSIRVQIDTAHVKPAQRANLERLGKFMIGINEEDGRPFHTSLNSVYRSLDFVNYKPNIEKTESELTLWQEKIGTTPEDKSKRIIDLGSGTGRISNGLALAGYENITGIDASPENLHISKEADSTQKVHYIEGSMTEVDVPDESVDEIICGGRTLPHAENFDNFSHVFQEANRCLKTGGRFFFDLPNPNKGTYAENRAHYLEFLDNVGISDTGKDTNEVAINSYVLVDSADGTNVYNRYCPPEQLVRRICESNGFELEIIRREPLAEGNPNENIYFMATKVRSTGYSPLRLYQFSGQQTRKGVEKAA